MCDGEYGIGVPIKTLRDWLLAIKNDITSVKFTIKDGTKLYGKLKRGQVTIKGRLEEEFPEWAGRKSKSLVRAQGAPFSRSLLNCAEHSAKDRFDAVFLGRINDKPYWAGTDGITLAAFPAELFEGIDYAIQSEAAKAIGNFYNLGKTSSHTIDIYFSERGMTTIGSYGMETFCLKNTAPMPDINTLFYDPKWEMLINKSELDIAVKRCSIFGETVYFDLRDLSNTYIGTSQSETGCCACSITIEPKGFQPLDEFFVFDIQRLKKILGSFDMDEFNMQMLSKTQPFFIRPVNSDEFYIMMPMHVQDEVPGEIKQLSMIWRDNGCQF